MDITDKGHFISREEFNALLKEADLNKKTFAQYLKVSYNAVNAWGSNDREVPYWVKSWLNLYICCKNGHNLRRLLKEHVCQDSSLKDFFTISLPIV